MADKYNGAFTGAQIDEAIGKALNGTLMNAETYDPQGKATDIFKYVDEHAPSGGSGVHIGPEPPTNGETVWIDTDDNEGSFYTAAQVDEKLANLPTGAQVDLLWENASPTSEFAAQTISLNLSAYSFVLISYTMAASTGNAKMYAFGFVGDDVRMATADNSAAWSTNLTTLGRHASITETGVQFYGGSVQGATSYTAHNGAIIPREIYGIKGVQIV